MWHISFIWFILFFIYFVSMLCFNIISIFCFCVDWFLIDFSNSPPKNPMRTQSSHRNKCVCFNLIDNSFTVNILFRFSHLRQLSKILLCQNNIYSITRRKKSRNTETLYIALSCNTRLNKVCISNDTKIPGWIWKQCQFLIDALSKHIYCLNTTPYCAFRGRSVCSSDVTWAKYNCQLFCDFCTGNIYKQMT